MTEKSGYVFWSIWLLIAVSSLFYLGIWGQQEDNGSAIALVTIFSIAILFSTIVAVFTIKYNKEYLNLGMNFVDSCKWFSIGFILWFLFIGSIKKMSGGSFFYSIFSSFRLPQNTMYSTVSSKLPLSGEVFMQGVLIPFAEELFWLISLPIMIVLIHKSLATYMPILKNKIVMMLSIIIISSGTFAYFHVGQHGSLAFNISAIIFRSLLLVLFWGETTFDWFEKVSILPAVGLGIHMSNNITVMGLMNFVIGMTKSVPGYMLMFLYIILFSIGSYGLYKNVMGEETI